MFVRISSDQSASFELINTVAMNTTICLVLLRLTNHKYVQDHTSHVQNQALFQHNLFSADI